MLLWRARTYVLILGTQSARANRWAVITNIQLLWNAVGLAAELTTNPVGPVTAIFLAALTGIGMLAGVWVIRRFESWAVLHTGELIAFAAGLLVSGALLHLIGRSVELVGTDRAVVWALASFIGFYLLEAHFVPHVHGRGESPIEDHHEHHHRARHIGSLAVLGFGFHSIVDGLSVGAGLSVGSVVGSVTATLVIVHKMPVGIAAMSALYHSGFPGRRAAWITATLALVTPTTVVISYLTFRDVSGELLGVLLALAGGSFLYVGAADLLPEGQARGRVTNTLMFLAGTLIMALIKIAVH